MTKPSPSPATATAIRDAFAETVGRTRVVEIDGHTVLVSASICSVIGDTWAWVWGTHNPTEEGDYSPIVPVITDWTDADEVRDVARQVLTAFQMANTTTTKG